VIAALLGAFADPALAPRWLLVGEEGKLCYMVIVGEGIRHSD
jgi:hypothetical protein